jgi:hypothetical protein
VHPPLKNRPGCLRLIFFLLLGGGLLYVFRYELNFLRNLALTLWSGQPVAGLPPLVDSLHISLFIGLNAAAMLCFTVLVCYWIAATVHPVQTNSEIYYLLGRLVHFIFGTHAPLVTVREGELLGGAELKSGSVALVDLNSALVIEKQRGSRSHKKTAANEGSTTFGLFPQMASVSGPGLVFLRHGEKLRGVVSLRKQFRVLQNTLGQTSDGIEVRTAVFTIFTLGQPASVVQVAYIGDPFPQNLRVVQLDATTHKVKSIRDDLDDQDKEEIHSFAQSFIYYVEPNSPLALGDKVRDYPPYQVDDQRILSAVYSRARNVSDGQPDSSWSDLPVMVAAETFRNMISRYTYDSLYQPEDPIAFPLQNEVKPAFLRQVRYLGVMSYQFLQRVNGEPLEVGQRVDHRQFRISGVQDLRGSKILRDRGIKIVHAGFSELIPTDPQVKQQRLEFWRARWQQQADLIRADLDLEVMRLRNRARAEKQREMSDKLSEIMQSSNFSEEALTLRIFQVLEDAASDPNTRQFLPKDTINFLRSLRLWLLPDENVRPARLEDRLSQEEE